MIIAFTGSLGSGKTLLMAYLLHEFQKIDRTILANFKLSFPYKQITFEDIENFKPNNCCLGLDELEIWLDCRSSMSKQNRIISYFILQTRKRYVDLFFTTQTFDQVEYRLRNQTNYVIDCEKIAQLPDSCVFRYTIINKSNFKSKTFLLHAEQDKFDLFDTEQVIEIPKARK